jgi:hypothetical protein
VNSGALALNPGDVIYIPETGPNHDRSRGHFFVVVTPRDDTDKILLVPICSYHVKADTTCLLKSTDYGELSHESFILYAKARFYSYTNIIGKLALKEIELRPSLNESVLVRVKNGFNDSSFCPRIYKNYLSATENE